MVSEEEDKQRSRSFVCSSAEDWYCGKQFLDTSFFCVVFRWIDLTPVSLLVFEISDHLLLKASLSVLTYRPTFSLDVEILHDKWTVPDV